MVKDLFGLNSEDWLIKEKGFDWRKQGMYESIFTLGNGYLGQRGSLEGNPSGSYRGTYIAGIFDKSESLVSQMVKSPGWIDFSIWIDDEKMTYETCKILFNERILDMKKGILHRVTRLKDKKGRIVRFESKRVVFAHQVRGALMLFSVTPENFSGDIKVISGLNGDVTNEGYYPEERVKHLNLVSMKRGQDYIYLESQTRDKKIKVALAASTLFDNPPQKFYKVNRMYGEKFAEVIVFDSQKGKTYNFTKWVSIFTSREGYDRQLESACVDEIHDMIRDGIEKNMLKHFELREKEWQIADIVIKGDKKAQLGIRFNLYHLIIAKPHHDPTLSIAAKFLSGEGYKGHVFWDTEIFALPFYIYTFPEAAKNLLLYRYYTLPGAILNAKDYGYKGAKFAWESADDGIETTPRFGYSADGKEVRIFTGDEEHHIVSDVVHGLYNFYGATKDESFLYGKGAEIVFQTALFWLSRIERRRGRYEVRKVIGPDEYHEHVDNNAFTNYLVMWHFIKAGELYKKMEKEAPAILKKLSKKIKLTKKHIEEMRLVSKIIYFPYDQKTDIIEQFEGYFSLEDFIIKQYDKNGMAILPEKAKGLDLNKTRLLKQADVVLLTHLFADRFSPEVKKKNYYYYEKRTMHQSSLSFCVYALMGLEVGDHKKAYNYFMKTSLIDLTNSHKNTAHGIHAAATGGAWQMVVHGFAGMKVRRGVLCFDPWLPEKWKKLSYSCMWEGSILRVSLSKASLSVKMEKDGPHHSMTIKVGGKGVSLREGKTAKIKMLRTR
ncbi:MAG: glycoside hydrolase family 65 protein [Candidatus Saganbacteria bacterium]|nr:glycoside hydrolase family 65 protein [Candidatus Saganbacteria bacterium]